MVHRIKTVQPYFGDMKTGLKTFESRKDDRNYQVGDILVLLEYDPRTDTYSGDVLVKRVTYKLPETACSPGYCVLQTEDYPWFECTKPFHVLNTQETVPWAILLGHEDQALINHGNQGFVRLNQRGGLCWSELLAVLEDRIYVKMNENRAKEMVQLIVEDYKRKYRWEEEKCQS